MSLVKKWFVLVVVFAMFAVGVSAQNLQLHYDARNTIHGNSFPRNFPRLVFEMFKLDSLGMTTLFVRTDFSDVNNRMGMAFLLLSRDQIISPKIPLMLHLEINGGIAKVETTGVSIPNAYLVGPSFMATVAGIDLNTYIAYRYNAFQKASHDVQWAVFYDAQYFNSKLTLQGWLNLWTENKMYERANFRAGKHLIYLFEQQAWFNLSSHLALGGQLELSNNFYHNEIKLYANPTLGVRWNF